MRVIPVALAAALALAPGAGTAATFNLTVPVPKADTGTVYVAVHASAETFPDGEAVAGAYVPVDGGSARVTVGELPAGRYALSVFQDTNGNGKMDSNLMGAPTEPVGFSRNARGNMGPPAFADAAVELTDTHTSTVKLVE